MPIEIKELQIKAIVSPDLMEKNAVLNKTALDRIKKEILRECLDAVKDLLKEQQER
jgi:hypothetical protein